MSEISFGNKKSQDAQVLQSEHKDYKKNLLFTEEFIKNCTGKLLPGMKVYLSDSEHLKKSIVVTCFLPGKSDKLGNFAAVISLHQWHDAFKKEFKEVFNGYHAMAKRWKEKADKIVKFPKPDHKPTMPQIQSEEALF